MYVVVTFEHEVLVERPLGGAKVNHQMPVLLIRVDVVEAGKGKVLGVIADGVTLPRGLLHHVERDGTWKLIKNRKMT